jgi:hypothetical protein
LSGFLICGIVGIMANPNIITLAWSAVTSAATSGLIIYLAKQYFEASVVKRITTNRENRAGQPGIPTPGKAITARLQSPRFGICPCKNKK